MKTKPADFLKKFHSCCISYVFLQPGLPIWVLLLRISILPGVYMNRLLEKVLIVILSRSQFAGMADPTKVQQFPLSPFFEKWDHSLNF